MRSIQNAVERILVRDADIRKKIGDKLINLSAYAKIIQHDVEERLMKPASIESIVTALSRSARELKKNKKTGSSLFVKQLSVHSPITEFVYSKNSDSLLSLANTMKKLGAIQSDAFFTLSTSTRDISIIMSSELVDTIKSLFTGKPRILKNNLVAISIRFDDQKVSEANIGTQFMQAIGSKGIVLDEVVSTFNEFTVVCDRKYLEDAVDVFHAFQGK